MVDALLFAFRDAIRTIPGYLDAAHCEIVADPEGRPPGRCGDWFAAVHQGPSTSTMDNALDERFSVSVTLSMRVTVPPDRAGDQFLAKKLAAQPGPGGSPSFNARTNQLAALLHMDWWLLQDANNYLISMLPQAATVHGFSEPARYRLTDTAMFVGDEWFGSEGGPGESDEPLGLKATIHFEDCRRGPQAIAAFS